MTDEYFWFSSTCHVNLQQVGFLSEKHPVADSEGRRRLSAVEIIPSFHLNDTGRPIFHLNPSPNHCVPLLPSNTIVAYFIKIQDIQSDNCNKLIPGNDIRAATSVWIRKLFLLRSFVVRFSQYLVLWVSKQQSTNCMGLEREESLVNVTSNGGTIQFMTSSEKIRACPPSYQNFVTRKTLLARKLVVILI